MDYTEEAARETGAALRASGTHDIVDAAVVISALSRGDEVVTSDPDDLLLIAGGLGRPLTVRRPKRATLSLAAA